MARRAVLVNGQRAKGKRFPQITLSPEDADGAASLPQLACSAPRKMCPLRIP
jgi:hypothetical protein